MAVPQSFPAKIYQILENESPDIIQWNDNGLSFRIVDHGRFEREIVPKYFRHNQISSVQRQLNLYGFKCISRGEFKRSFFHPKFRRGDWETVRKLTRYAPVKKSTPLPGDGTFPSPTEPGAVLDEKKLEERPAQHAPMYNTFLHPYPGGMNGGLSDASAAYNRNFMMPGVGPSNTAWFESWDRQESANSMNVRMMGLPPHFAYAMMPIHAAAAMHHMNATQGRLPLPAGLPASVSSNNLVRVDSVRPSDLSSRLGFKFGPDGSVLSSENVMPQGELRSISAPAENVAQPSHAILPQTNSLEQFQAHENGIASSSSRNTLHANDHAYHPTHGQNSDYDFMMEFGMFDGVPPTDLYHTTHSSTLATSSNSSNAGAGMTGPSLSFHSSGPSVPVMRLPHLTHDLSMVIATPLEQNNNALLSATAALGASPSIEKATVASHAHAALEVETTTPVNEENEQQREIGLSVESSSNITTQDGSSVSSTVPPITDNFIIPAANEGAAVDMACNTMLTYSKIHDALVYYIVSDA